MACARNDPGSDGDLTKVAHEFGAIGGVIWTDSAPKVCVSVAGVDAKIFNLLFCGRFPKLAQTVLYSH